MKPLLAFAVAAMLLGLPAGHGRADGAPGVIRLAYDIHASGILIASSEFDVELLPDSFDVRFAIRTRGLPKLFKDIKLMSRAEGERSWSDLRPVAYRSEYWKKARKRRWVEIDYADGRVGDLRLEPLPWEEERAPVRISFWPGSFDPLSAAVALLDQVHRAGRCEGEIEVYDGRRLFRATLEHQGMVDLDGWGREAYRGPALKCRVAVGKIAGFEVKELRGDRYPESLTVFLAPIVPGAPWMPVRLEGRNRLGKVTAKLVSGEGRGLGLQRAGR